MWKYLTTKTIIPVFTKKALSKCSTELWVGLCNLNSNFTFNLINFLKFNTSVCQDYLCFLYFANHALGHDPTWLSFTQKQTLDCLSCPSWSKKLLFKKARWHYQQVIEIVLVFKGTDFREVIFFAINNAKTCLLCTISFWHLKILLADEFFCF